MFLKVLTHTKTFFQRDKIDEWFGGDSEEVEEPDFEVINTYPEV